MNCKHHYHQHNKNLNNNTGIISDGMGIKSKNSGKFWKEQLVKLKHNRLSLRCKQSVITILSVKSSMLQASSLYGLGTPTEIWKPFNVTTGVLS